MRVPVLSKTKAPILEASSRWLTFLMKMPRRAAAATAATTAVGVASTTAQGQAMTRKAITLRRSSVNHQVTHAIISTVGV